MAELVTVARPYAKAAFRHATEKGQAERWSAMLGFAAAAMQDVRVAQALDNPQLTAEQQANLFIKICGDQLDGPVQNLVRQLTLNKRLAVLPQISILFNALLADEMRKQDVEVYSPFELAEAEKVVLKKALEKKLGKQVNLQTGVDKSLIGGVFIRAGDMVIDGSVRGKLQALSQTLS